MASTLLIRVQHAIQKYKQVFDHFMRGGFPPELALAIDTTNFHNVPVYKPKYMNLKDIIDNGFVWGIFRRTLEKRNKRKYGFPKWHWKPLVARTDILTCNSCGHDRLSDTLCPFCYGRAKEETKKMQEDIQAKLKLDPVEHEVVVLYEGERPQDYWKAQRIVELPRKRPSWFTSNLLQQTAEETEVNKEVPQMVKPKADELA